MDMFKTKLIAFFLICECILPAYGINAYGNQKKETMIEYVKVEIYYYDWDVQTRYALTPDIVRTNYWLKITIVNKAEIDRFIQWLHTEKMKKIDIKEIYDIRLVIDLFDRDGKRTSYYATQFDLINENATLKLRIDDKFKTKFNFKEP